MQQRGDCEAPRTAEDPLNDLQRALGLPSNRISSDRLLHNPASCGYESVPGTEEQVLVLDNELQRKMRYAVSGVCVCMRIYKRRCGCSDITVKM